MQSGHGLIYVCCQSKLLLHGAFCAFGPWINRQMQRRSLRFSDNSQFHLVITRRSERTSRSDAGVEGTWYLNGILIAQIPCEAVHPLIGGNCFWSLGAGRAFRPLFACFFFFAGKM